MELFRACITEDTLAGVYQPEPSGVSWLAPGFLFYVAHGLGLVGWDGRWNGAAADLEAAGREYCRRPWRTVVSSKYAANYCFGSVYVPVLLRALSIDTERLDYARTLRGFEISWALGAMLYFVTERSRTSEEVCADVGDGRTPRGGVAEDEGASLPADAHLAAALLRGPTARTAAEAEHEQRWPPAALRSAGSAALERASLLSAKALAIGCTAAVVGVAVLARAGDSTRWVDETRAAGGGRRFVMLDSRQLL